MLRQLIKSMPFLALFSLVLTLLFLASPNAFKVAQAQQPTGSLPTVTGSPSGPIITVAFPEQINVRSGPNSTIYPAIGVLLPGQTAPAIGRSPGGEWIQIQYPGVAGGIGWVYAPLVLISPGGATLLVVEAPPTPTLQITATINPTLAAAYIPAEVATRMPTFTAPPPLAVPTFVASSGAEATSGFPMGLVIVSLGLVGAFGSLISFLRGR